MNRYFLSSPKCFPNRLLKPYNTKKNLQNIVIFVDAK